MSLSNVMKYHESRGLKVEKKEEKNEKMSFSIKVEYQDEEDKEEEFVRSSFRDKLIELSKYEEKKLAIKKVKLKKKKILIILKLPDITKKTKTL